jgi:hypothetical protein
MDSQDRDRFARALLVLAEVTRLEIPEGYPELLWTVLAHYPWPVVERGPMQGSSAPRPSS